MNSHISYIIYLLISTWKSLLKTFIIFTFLMIAFLIIGYAKIFEELSFSLSIGCAWWIVTFLIASVQFVLHEYAHYSTADTYLQNIQNLDHQWILEKQGKMALQQICSVSLPQEIDLKVHEAPYVGKFLVVNTILGIIKIGGAIFIGLIIPYGWIMLMFILPLIFFVYIILTSVLIYYWRINQPKQTKFASKLARYVGSDIMQIARLKNIQIPNYWTKLLSSNENDLFLQFSEAIKNEKRTIIAQWHNIYLIK